MGRHGSCEPWLQPPPPGKGRNKLKNVPLPSAFETVVKCGSHHVCKDRHGSDAGSQSPCYAAG